MTNSEHQLAPKEPTQEMEHPMQQIVVAEDGVVRFRSNAIVRYLLDNGGIDLNALARLNFSIADQNQFAQLIGYSVSGFGDLSYADPAVVEQADALAAKLYEPRPSAHVELLPCPFCGAEPLLRESPGPLWVVQCFECGAEASSRTDVRDVAIECWNRRAPSSPPSAETSGEVERLTKENEHLRALQKLFNENPNALYSQVERLRAENAQELKRIMELVGMNEALRAALAAAQPNAERYQWLRARCYPIMQPLDADDTAAVYRYTLKLDSETKTGLDAAIDAARAKGKESGNG